MSVRPRIVWGGLLAAGGLYEFWALVNDEQGDTFSEVTRDVFGTHTRRGRVLFTVAYAGFSLWFVPHIAAYAFEKAEEAVSEQLGTARARRRVSRRAKALLTRILWPTS